MPEPSNQDVTLMLSEVRRGVSGAADRLLPLVYDELRGIAGKLFRKFHDDGTSIQPTILVHDAFMKLTQNTNIEWADRAHFYAVAAKVTRDLLVDHARRRMAAKRGHGWNRISLNGVEANQSSNQLINILDLEQVLKELGEVAPRQEQIVEMRFFAGLTTEEIAEILGVSTRTIMYDWRMARAWLRSRLDDLQE